eukprot:11207456-Lingulodinium_polyedra.AAC.1
MWRRGDRGTGGCRRGDSNTRTARSRRARNPRNRACPGTGCPRPLPRRQTPPGCRAPLSQRGCGCASGPRSAHHCLPW